MLKRSVIASVIFALVAAGVSANPNDLNKDKRISPEEFEAFRKNQAAKNGKEPNPDEIKMAFHDKDLDGDGYLSYKEFNGNPFDPNGDKSITFDEYSSTMKRRGERSGKMQTDKWLKENFAKKDTDGDGVLSYQELAKPVK